MSLWVVVGGQYGSEGKGKLAAFITLREEIDICIRCGGPNSGHSFIADDGRQRLVRQLPTGYIRPETRLLIPAGALVDPEVLCEEIATLRLKADRVGVDQNAMVIEPSDRENEQRLGLRQRLSSTLCGVGSAVSRRALRGPDVRLAKDAAAEHSWLKELLTDVSAEANTAINNGKKVLVEGTQGFGLSLYHSQQYPKATSRDTTASGFLAEVGLSPLLVTEIVLVLRTFPIRVAGEQAGTFHVETDWETVQRESGYPYPIHEITSVTRAVRRIGRFDWNLASRACEINRPTKIAINGLDYIDYRNWGVRRWTDLSESAQKFIENVEQTLRVNVEYCSASPKLDDVFLRREIFDAAARAYYCPATHGGLGN